MKGRGCAAVPTLSLVPASAWPEPEEVGVEDLPKSNRAAEKSGAEAVGESEPLIRPDEDRRIAFPLVNFRPGPPPDSAAPSPKTRSSADNGGDSTCSVNVARLRVLPNRAGMLVLAAVGTGVGSGIGALAFRGSDGLLDLACVDGSGVWAEAGAGAGGSSVLLMMGGGVANSLRPRGREAGVLSTVRDGSDTCPGIG